MTKGIRLPQVNEQIFNEKKTLPFNGRAVTEKSFSFSFACFDRSHKLFNLGDNTETGSVSGNWFIDLIDCFKSVSNMSIVEVKASMHDLHPVDWSNANASVPDGGEQWEFWQFRINKSKGRVIGFLIDGVFYVVWLDPHHNLTDSEGYGTVRYYKPALSLYEQREMQIQQLTDEIERLKGELETAEELLSEK